MTSARQLVFKLLHRMDFSAYSNIILDKALDKSELSVQDKKFATALFYGIIERKITLDYIIKKYSSKRLDKLDSDILQILRMGIYQLLYLSSVPDNAAVNESVNLAKINDMHNAAGFVNAVLRSFIRDDKQISYPTDKIEFLSVKFSCPKWLVQKWSTDFGHEEAIKLCENTIGKSEITIRVNTLKITSEKLIEVLKIENIDAVQHSVIKDCLTVSGGALEQTNAFKKGYFHVQDFSSQLCCMALDPKPNEVVLDICAAPGGKTFTIAQLAENKSQLYAYDLHEKRVNLIKQGAERLGVNVKCFTANAKEYNENIPKADKILCDVPCSGLGVIRKKPEIKYKNPDDFKNLPEVQYDILSNASKYLKTGGELIYSTCSLNNDENQNVIKRFLEINTEFEGVSFLTEFGKPFSDYFAVILPDYFNCDGFFISKIRKIR